LSLSDRPISEIRDILSQKQFVVEFSDSLRQSGAYSSALNDYECGASAAMDAYLANPEVISALHVKADTPGMTYRKTAEDLRPLYSELIQKYQILIYSGI
jgi:hypothetical protein